jgi:hypothetical protein
MHARARFTTLALTALTLPAYAEAQGVRIDLAPSAGMIRPLDAPGAVTAIDQAWYLQLERADAAPWFGATVEARVNDGPLAARVTALAALPAATRATFNCRPGLACPAVLVESDAELSSITGFLDLVISPLSGRFRPWLAAGPGLTRFSVDWEAPAVLVEAGHHAETVPLLHAGAGIDIGIGNGALHASVGFLRTPRGDPIGPIDAPTSAVRSVRRAAGTDLLLSVGWSLLRF